MEQQDFLELDGHSHSAVQPKMRDHKMIGMRVAILQEEPAVHPADAHGVLKRRIVTDAVFG